MAKRVRSSENGNDTLITTLIGNRIPPYSAESEMAVLGSMLLDNSAITKAAEWLTKESFYVERNKMIYETIMSMFEKGIQVDLLTLSEELKRQGRFDKVGGNEYLANLIASVPTAENVEYYCRIVQEKFFKRELLLLLEKYFWIASMKMSMRWKKSIWLSE
jgi:replicative DNA helicase